ncbi:MAG: hypothetical protein KDI83_10355 [Gammaproteobacteria bacterium]|nr:hypothetical protein [Gammaproteobacteria bacterium]
MLQPTRTKVTLLLLLIVVVTAWSKLHILDADDHAPQRWRVDEYPGFQRYK